MPTTPKWARLSASAACAVLAGLLASADTHAQTTGGRGGSAKQPESQYRSDGQLRRCIAALRDARRDVEKARHNYGGHKASVVKAITYAQKQLELARQAERKHRHSNGDRARHALWAPGGAGETFVAVFAGDKGHKSGGGSSGSTGHSTTKSTKTTGSAGTGSTSPSTGQGSTGSTSTPKKTTGSTTQSTTTGGSSTTGTTSQSKSTTGGSSTQPNRTTGPTTSKGTTTNGGSTTQRPTYTKPSQPTPTPSQTSTGKNGQKGRDHGTASLEKAIRDLRRTRNILQKADHDYGGHRQKAVKAVSSAISELRQAIKSAEQKDGHTGQSQKGRK
jgi:hypothetical protein